MAATGRPTIYDEKLSAEMCVRITAGESVRSITSDDEMPAMATFFRWLNEKEDFKEQYAIAKQLGAEALFADILSISDDGTNDWMEKMDAQGQANGWSVNGEAIARSRLRVDSRKWYLSKVLPKVYGDKQQIETTHTFAQMSDDEVNSRIKALENELKSQD